MGEKLTGREELDAVKEVKIASLLENAPQIFTEYHDDLKYDEKSVNTIRNYLDYNIKFAEFVSGGTIKEDFYLYAKPDHIRSFVLKVKGESSRCGRWAAIHSFYAFLVREGYVNVNPTDRTKPPKRRIEHVITYLTPEEIDEVFESVYRNSSAGYYLRDNAILCMFLTTGLRCSALSQINLEDVNLSDQTVSVIEKGGKVRTVLLSNHTAKSIKEWLIIREREFNGSNSDALFVSKNGLRISNNAIAHMVEKHTANIDKHITPHKLRSTAATNMAANGVPIHVVQEMLGHKSIVTTKRYTAAVDNAKADAVNILDSLIGGKNK